MDLNEKRSKRPRIGQQNPMSYGGERTSYNTSENSENNDKQTSYHERTYNQTARQYNNRNNQNGYRYNNGGYRPRYNNDFEPSDSNIIAEGIENGEQRQNQGYHRYDNNSGYRQGGYNNRQNGYNNNRQGSYNNQGYNRQRGNDYRQNGYGNHQNGYNQDNRRDGFNNRQGGYSHQGYNRQNGYNNNRQGGYNNQGNRKRLQQNEFGMPRGGKSFVPRPKRIEYEEVIPDPNEQIRLNKFMANAGICSRREADEYIQQGLVRVNGQVVTELGTKITHSDTVEYDEKIVALERKCYILLNKPKDCVTTADDPNGRLTVMDLVKNACEERIYPVGRLDRNTTGVLLLTNDGDLASKLTHPKYVKKKIYHVWTDKDISEDDMQRIADGIELEDGSIHADAISYATDTDRNQAGIEIHSGRNRIVRRIFESLGYHVTKLDRVYFAGLTKKNLPRGRWRYLTQEEVNFLKMGSFE